MPFLDETGLARLVLKIKEKFATKDVATSSKDGLMSVDDKKRLDGINDYTTGINLLRGTRDFKAGTNIFKKTTGSWIAYTDGFKIGSAWSVSIDSEGYGVAYANEFVTGASSNNYINAPSFVKHVSSGTYMTLSCDYMIEDVNTANSDTIIGYINCINENGTQTGARQIKVKDVFGSIENVKTGMWQKFIYPFALAFDTGDDVFIEPLFVINNSTGANGGVSGISIRKIKLEIGKINNPIWSPSPFDTDYINDATTGINLLRGTRDFTLGHIVAKPLSATYKDGFSTSGNAYLIREDGNGFKYIAPDNSANCVVYTNVIYDVKQGDELTLVFDGNISSQRVNENRYVITINEYSDDSTARIDFTDVLPSHLGVTSNGYIEGTREYVYRFKIKNANTTRIVIPLTLYSSYPVLLEVGKIAVYRGSVNNPIWSASPFDVAQEDEVLGINDMTTGINLLRETRDFTKGTTSVARPSTGTLFSDGCQINSSTTSNEIDSDGFIDMVVEVPASSNAVSGALASVFDVIPGEELTISFDVMRESDVVSSSIARIVRFTNPIADGNTGSGYRTTIYATDAGVSFDKIGEWEQAIYHFTVPSDTKAISLEAYAMGTNAKIKVRKYKIERGYINHPIWSPSPFDKVQDNVPNVYNRTTLGDDQIWFSKELTKFFGTNTTITGSLKIVLPHKANVSDMIRFKVSIYDYHSNTICDYHIKGYVYSANRNWFSGYTDAITIANPKYRNANVPIKFGVTEDEYPIVEIGTDTTVWSYLHVVISEVISNTASIIDNLSDWQIIIDPEVAVTNVVKTIEDPSVIKDVATVSETLSYVRNSLSGSAVTTLPVDDVFVGELPSIDHDAEQEDSTTTLPSEGFLLGGLNNPDQESETEGDDDPWQLM